MLIKSWVPENGGEYAGSCIAVIAAAVLVQALKAWRVLLEVRWATRQRPACCSRASCGAPDDEDSKGSKFSTSTAPSEEAPRRGLPRLAPARDQLRRNAVRAVFTGVIVFLDYMLMLIVMSFNIGIIASAVGGFALGALAFGHLGERAGGAAGVAVGTVAPDSENDLEVHVIEPQSCCNTHRV